MMADYFRTLARYNAWANRRLYDACARLSEADYRKARPVYFGSIHGTLNHLLVGDRLWMGRFEAVPSGVSALEQILYDDFARLRAAREAEDSRIIAYTERLTDEAVAGTLRFRTMAPPPTDMATPLSLALGHLFNHQTHHRGHAHSLLSQTEVPPPSLDLIFYLRDLG